MTEAARCIRHGGSTFAADGSRTLKPREGNPYEIGLKAELADGRLNGRVALFQIEDRKRALADPEDDD